MNVVVAIGPDGTTSVVGPFRTLNRAQVHADYLEREADWLEATAYEVEKPE